MTLEISDEKVTFAVGAIFHFNSCDQICRKGRRDTEFGDFILPSFLYHAVLYQIVVGLSLLATYTSALGLISQSAESYIVGTEFIWNSITNIIATIPVTVYFVPAFRRLDLNSCYEVRMTNIYFKLQSFQVTGYFRCSLLKYDLMRCCGE